MPVNQRRSGSPAPAPAAGELKSALIEAEALRRALLKDLAVVVGLVVVVVVGSLTLRVFGLVVMGSFLGLVLAIAALMKHSGDYAKAYKGQVIPHLLREVDPSLDYQAERGMDRGAFEDSHFVPGCVTGFRSEDLITGEVGGRRRQICEMVVHQGQGRGKREVFRGLFSETRLDCGLKGHVVVVPDLAERLLGKLGVKLQGLTRSRGELVHFGDSAFEQAFAVYADHAIEAQRLLTPGLRKQLLALRERSGCDIGLTVCRDRAYIMVRSLRNHFEPSLFKSALDERPLARFRQDLATVLDVFEAIPLAEVA